MVGTGRGRIRGDKKNRRRQQIGRRPPLRYRRASKAIGGYY